MSDPQRLPDEERTPTPPPPPDSGQEAEFDLPFTLPARPRPRPVRKDPGAIRAFLFFTAVFIVGYGGGQFLGFGIALLLLGKRLPADLQDPAAWQAWTLNLMRQPPVIFCAGAASLLLSLLITLAFARGWDRRPLSSVGFQVDARSPRQFGAGLLLGAALITAVFAIEAGLGWLRVVHALPFPEGAAHAAIWFLALLPAAAAEEVMLRGYAFQALEEQWGGAAAALLTALVFGALHRFNPGAGWASFWGIVGSGILFGVAYLVTRRLWLPIGLHVAWNLFEGPILGFPVSGFDLPSVLQIRAAGPALWTGGSFGPEAGLLGVLASAAGAAILLTARRRA
jgi:membrane protease YdiL (CAAX protease family)